MFPRAATYQEQIEAMLFSLFRRGRSTQTPFGNRTAALRTVLKAAAGVSGYQSHLVAAHLNSSSLIDAAPDLEIALRTVSPISFNQYRSLFSARRPSWTRQPDGRETRSALMLPYAEARRGLQDCHNEPQLSVDLYSPTGVTQASADLFRLARALDSSTAPIAKTTRQTGHAVAVFSGMDAGMLTESQRDQLWMRYQVPLFEQFLGTDGRVIASECEVHAGLHLRTEDVILEIADGELLLTSLTDLDCPAIRVLTGLHGAIEHEVCDCGRVEPRILQLQFAGQPGLAAIA